MLVIAGDDRDNIRRLDLLTWRGVRRIDDITTRAAVAKRPGVWAFGWADCVIPTEGGGIEGEVVDGEVVGPLIRTRWGFLRWTAKEGTDEGQV